MNVKWIALLSCLVCLILTVAVSAQEDREAIADPVKVVRMYQKDLPGEVDLQAFLSSGEVKVTGGVQCIPSRVTPGPAPAPYPQAVVWEKGIEQLGASPVACDGITFLSGDDWKPRELVLMLWKIRIPRPNSRLASEFQRNITLSLWVDFSEDKVWGKSERVVFENFNIAKLFPYRWSALEIWYLTYFFVPTVSDMSAQCGGGWTKYTTKLWMRSGLSYDDPDVSPAGQALFGEYEDYQIIYSETRSNKKVKG